MLWCAFSPSYFAVLLDVIFVSEEIGEETRGWGLPWGLINTGIIRLSCGVLKKNVKRKGFGGIVSSPLVIRLFCSRGCLSFALAKLLPAETGSFGGWKIPVIHGIHGPFQSSHWVILHEIFSGSTLRTVWTSPKLATLLFFGRNPRWYILFMSPFLGWWFQADGLPKILSNRVRIPMDLWLCSRWSWHFTSYTYRSDTKGPDSASCPFLLFLLFGILALLCKN